MPARSAYRLHRFDHAEWLGRFDDSADGWQLDKNDVADLLHGKRRDANPATAVEPLVLVGVLRLSGISIAFAPCVHQAISC